MPVIGLFDSGLGGMSVARAILARRRDASLWIVGDTCHVPYGGRPLSEVRGFALGLTEYLVDGGCSAVVMACNISSAVALDEARHRHDVPIFGMVEAGALAASDAVDDPIGVLATEGTVRTGAYTAALSALRSGVRVMEVPCPDFVPLVEAGRWTSDDAFAAAREYSAPLVEASVRTVILGCTHYPFLDAAIRSAFPWPVRLIDPAERVAMDVATLLPPAPRPGDLRVEATADPSSFAHRGSVLLGSHFRATLCPIWGWVAAAV
jgi:glutamate racemase